MLVSRGKEALAAAELYMDPLSLTKMDVKSKGKELSAATGVSADGALAPLNIVILVLKVLMDLVSRVLIFFTFMIVHNERVEEMTQESSWSRRRETMSSKRKQEEGRERKRREKERRARTERGK